MERGRLFLVVAATNCKWTFLNLLLALFSKKMRAVEDGSSGTMSDVAAARYRPTFSDDVSGMNSMDTRGSR